jgi:hypothetical protein
MANVNGPSESELLAYRSRSDRIAMRLALLVLGGMGAGALFLIFRDVLTR